MVNALALVLVAAQAIPAPAQQLTMPDAVARAVARNPSVAIAAAQIERADGLVREARAGWYPTLIGNATYTRLDHERKLGDRTLADVNQVAGNVQLTVPLLAPVAWANTSQANRNRRIAEGNATEVRREIAAATARAYLTVVAQHRIIAATEAARENAKAHFDFAHTRLAGGLGHSIDEVRAQQDLATVEVQVQAAYTGLARAQEALAVLVGADGTVDATADVQLPPPPALDAALADARALRPDVKSLERRVASSQKAIDELWAYYAPYLAAVGQPFFQLGSALQPQSGWQAQLVLTLPLYDGGTRSGLSQERQALLHDASANLDAALRQAQRSDQALLAAREAARLAKRASALAKLAYQAGATTNIEVIDADRRERDADVAAAQAEDAARQSRLDLLVASGRFP
jgi:outer membrane protein